MGTLANKARQLAGANQWRHPGTGALLTPRAVAEVLASGTRAQCVVLPPDGLGVVSVCLEYPGGFYEWLELAPAAVEVLAGAFGMLAEEGRDRATGAALDAMQSRAADAQTDHERGE